MQTNVYNYIAPTLFMRTKSESMYHSSIRAANTCLMCGDVKLRCVHFDGMSTS